MKALITGAAGSIGRHLIKELIKRGYSCRCLVRQTTDISPLEGTNVELVYGDLRFPKTLKGIVDGVDVVFHLAAEGHVSFTTIEAFKNFLKVNVEGTRNLLKECIGSNIKKFVHFSSTAAMGLIQDTVADENTPCMPKTPYQKTKYQSEQVVMYFHKKENIPAVIIRPCMVYGEDCKGEYLRIFSYMRKGIFPRIGRGKKLTPLVYIHNIIPAIANAATLGKPGNVYILVDSSVKIDVLHKKVCGFLGISVPYIYMPPVIAFSLIKVYEILCHAIGKEPLFSLKNVKSTVANRIFNSTKARRQLKFRRVVGFDESLKATIDRHG